MKHILLISLALFVTTGALAGTPSSLENMSWATHLTPDFVIGLPPAAKAVQKSSAALANFIPADPCDQHIIKAVCHVKSLEQEDQCLETPAAAFENLRTVRNRLPSQFQTMLCNVHHILIADDMMSLAMAGTSQDGKTSFMAFSTSLVAENPSANAVFGWKEQKVFGSKAPRYELDKNGPLLSVRSNSSLTTFQYIMTHELSHLFDIFNKANNYTCTDGFDCNKEASSFEEYQEILKHQQPVDDSWGVLSWKNGLQANDKNVFPLQSKLCFYGCKENLKLSEMNDFYLQLDHTNFVSAYAALNPMEDFAESVTYYFMTQGDDELKFRVSTGKVIYFQEWRWTQNRKKHNWIELFFEGDLKYPKAL